MYHDVISYQSATSLKFMGFVQFLFFFPYVSLCNAFDYEDWHGKVILCS